jgi:hypothetical protein
MLAPERQPFAASTQAAASLRMNDEVFDLEESIEPEIPIRNFLRIEERHRGSGPWHAYSASIPLTSINNRWNSALLLAPFQKLTNWQTIWRFNQASPARPCLCLDKTQYSDPQTSMGLGFASRLPRHF